MGHKKCVVINCKNSGRNSTVKFYKFPKASWKRKQRIQWIIAVNRKNIDGSPWSPRDFDVICSDHFIGGKKAEEELSPSYIPTIFPKKHQTVTKSTDLNRQNSDNCFIGRRIKKIKLPLAMSERNFNITDNLSDSNLFRSKENDKNCQVNMYYGDSNSHHFNMNIFICNRFIHDKICDVEIQTDIFQAPSHESFIDEDPLLTKNILSDRLPTDVTNKNEFEEPEVIIKQEIGQFNTVLIKNENFETDELHTEVIIKEENFEIEDTIHI